MPELYRLTDWSADGSSANLGAYDDLDPEMQSIVMGLAQRIYDGEHITYDPDLLNATVKPYIDGITKGYGKSLADVDWNTPDAKTLQKLTENVFQFSASKDFHILSDMTAALKDSDGKMRSFDDFQAEVDKMNVKYNQNWLRTEYNQAVASSQCAARWTDFEKHSKSMPFLQYQAVMDGNTRAEHAALNGVIKRVDSDFWDKYYPPNGWGCRCEVIQLPGKNHKETPAKDMKFCKVDDMWKVNVGKKGVVFPKGHPYFMGQCQRCNPSNLKLYVKGNPQCEACLLAMTKCKEDINGAQQKKTRVQNVSVADKIKIYEMPINKQYTDCVVGNGTVKEHLLVCKANEDYSFVRNVAETIAECGNVVLMNPEVNYKELVGRGKIYPDFDENFKGNPDLFIKKYGYVDVKSPTSPNKCGKWANYASTKQNAVVCLTDFRMEITEQQIEDRNQVIWNSEYYKHDYILWVIKGEFREYKRPK